MTDLCSPTQVLADTVRLDGADALDIGCGEGGLVRFMRSQGACVVGAECGDEMRRRAIANDPDHAGDYVDAVGEDLPFDDESFDVIVYSYSLHHVPIDRIPAALDEAHRVLRHGGVLYVVEPAIDEPENSVALYDERVERTAAQAGLDGAATHGFETRDRFVYLSESVRPDFESYLDTIVAVAPERAAMLDDHRERLHANFHRLGQQRADGWVFIRRNLVAVLDKPPRRTGVT
jgi:ubiquinone/menaquinone biosynthesis C-methylase UbiE